MRSRVLAVDDNHRNLMIIQRCLEREFTVRLAASGEEALEIASGWEPDLVLLDIMMPGMNGYETCRALRTDQRLVGTKIVMVSARSQTSDRLEGYTAGADDYVVKPFEHNELLAKVRVYARLKSVQEVDRLKSDLMDLLNHETGTPLTGIVGALGLLRDTELSEEQHSLLDVAESSVERLQALVQRTSMITELKARSAPAVLERVAIRELIEDAVRSVGVLAENAGVRVAGLGTGQPVIALGDPSLLQWAVEALLDNAVRMSPRGGLVLVRIEEHDAGVRISVSDQGRGIEPELMPRMFEEFLVRDIRHHKKGTGLSLAAARLIARHHEGDLSLRPEPERGTVFAIDLPRERLLGDGAEPAARAA
jgi:two-component system, sensor histidine kinase and response regulator